MSARSKTTCQHVTMLVYNACLSAPYISYLIFSHNNLCIFFFFEFLTIIVKQHDLSFFSERINHERQWHCCLRITNYSVSYTVFNHKLSIIYNTRRTPIFLKIITNPDRASHTKWPQNNWSNETTLWNNQQSTFNYHKSSPWFNPVRA